jgi:hypothetical protein
VGSRGETQVAPLVEAPRAPDLERGGAVQPHAPAAGHVYGGARTRTTYLRIMRASSPRDASAPSSVSKSEEERRRMP